MLSRFHRIPERNEWTDGWIELLYQSAGNVKVKEGHTLKERRWGAHLIIGR